MSSEGDAWESTRLLVSTPEIVIPVEKLYRVQTKEQAFLFHPNATCPGCCFGFGSVRIFLPNETTILRFLEYDHESSSITARIEAHSDKTVVGAIGRTRLSWLQPIDETALQESSVEAETATEPIDPQISENMQTSESTPRSLAKAPISVPPVGCSFDKENTIESSTASLESEESCLLAVDKERRSVDENVDEQKLHSSSTEFPRTCATSISLQNDLSPREELCSDLSPQDGQSTQNLSPQCSQSPQHKLSLKLDRSKVDLLVKEKLSPEVGLSQQEALLCNDPCSSERTSPDCTSRDPSPLRFHCEDNIDMRAGILSTETVSGLIDAFRAKKMSPRIFLRQLLDGGVYTLPGETLRVVLKKDITRSEVLAQVLNKLNRLELKDGCLSAFFSSSKSKSRIFVQVPTAVKWVICSKHPDPYLVHELNRPIESKQRGRKFSLASTVRLSVSEQGIMSIAKGDVLLKELVNLNVNASTCRIEGKVATNKKGFPYLKVDKKTSKPLIVDGRYQPQVYDEWLKISVFGRTSFIGLRM